MMINSTSSMMSSPRKMATIQGVASPKSPKVTPESEVKKFAGKSPRTPVSANLNTATTQVFASIKAAKKLTKNEMTGNQVEVMELPARLEAGANQSIINLKSASSGDRVRNAGGGGDSCMRLPLECISKSEIKHELNEGRLSFHHLGYREEIDNEEEEPDEEFDDEKMTTVLGPDRARFNVWKGINYDLHVLGNFKSDFERRVKSFQRPETKRIAMDPFCRSESGLKDEPCDGEAFLVWKSRNGDQWQHQSSSSAHDITTATLALSEEEEDPNDSDTDSLPDPEMKEYMCKQKQRKEQGLNPSGETLVYDEEFGVVRNLHRESHSLTNYGVMPDDTWMGKANIFYPEMTAAEKKMLKAITVSKDQSTSNIIKGSPRTLAV